MADDASSDSSQRREALLAPLYTKQLGDPPVELPVVCSGRLRFASLNASGEPNMSTVRGTAAPQRSGRGRGGDGDGGANADGSWCELFADPDTGDSRLAVFDAGSRPVDRNTAGADPRELLTFHWKTKALRPRTTSTTAAGVHFFTITYFFSAVHDERFAGPADSGGGDAARKYARVDRAAVLMPSAEAMGEWFQKLQAALQMIPPPIWMGPLQKKPTQGPGARRALSRSKKRFFVLDGANIIYYADNKLLDEKGKLTLTTAATVALVHHAGGDAPGGSAATGVPNFTLVVGSRTLVAESLQKDPQLRLADIENWVLKIQQTIDALAELEQQLQAEALQPEGVSGAEGSGDEEDGSGGTDGDDDEDPPFYDDDGNPLPLRHRARVGKSLALGIAEEEAADGYHGWAKVYSLLVSPHVPKWAAANLLVAGGVLRSLLAAGPRATPVDVPLTPFCTAVENNSLSRSKPLGVEVAHPRGLFFVYGCDASLNHLASEPAHRQMAAQVNKQLLDIRYARRGIVNPFAYANATTHYLVLEDVEVDMGTKCNIMVNWCIASEPEFRQSTGTRFDVSKAAWPRRRKYALNQGHWGAPDVCTLVLEVLLVDAKLPNRRVRVDEETGLVDEAYIASDGTQRRTDPFPYIRGNFQHYVPLGDLDYTYADQANPVRTVVNFGSKGTLAFRAFLEPKHLLAISGVAFEVVDANPTHIGGDEDGGDDDSSKAAAKFLRNLAGYQLSLEDVGADVCNLYPQAGARELTPAGDLVRCTGPSNDGAGSGPRFDRFEFRLGQIVEGTRLKFAFVDRRGRIGGLATVPGAALQRAVATRKPATVFVDLRRQAASGARVKMAVTFERHANFDREFKGTLDERARRSSVGDVAGGSSAVDALSRSLAAENAAAQAHGDGAGGGGGMGKTPSGSSLLLEAGARVYFESWITKLPRSSQGFVPQLGLVGKHHQDHKAHHHHRLGSQLKRRFLTLDDGVLRYYTNASKVDLKGQMSLFSHTEVRAVEGVENALEVHTPKDPSAPAPGAQRVMTPAAKKRRPLAFVCEDAEAFHNWKIVLRLAIHQLLAADVQARQPQPPPPPATAAVAAAPEADNHNNNDSPAVLEPFTDDEGDGPDVDDGDARAVELQELERRRRQEWEQSEAALQRERELQQRLDAQQAQYQQQHGTQQEFMRLRQLELAEQQRRIAEEEARLRQQQQQQEQSSSGGMAVNPYHVSKMGTQAAVDRSLQNGGGGIQNAANLFAGSKFSFQEEAAPPRPPPRELSALEQARLRHQRDHQAKLDQLERERQAAAAAGYRLEAGDITTNTIVHVEGEGAGEEDAEALRKARRRRAWCIAGVVLLVLLVVALLLFVAATAMARLTVVSTGVMIESDIPQLTRPPNAVSAALWLRGQAEYAFTNPGYLTVCLSRVDASLFYVDRLGDGAPPTLTKVTPASHVDLMYPHAGTRSRGGGPADTCVPPYATVRLQLPFEVRVMLSPPLTQSIADDCSASAQRFAVDVLGSGTAYIKSLPGISLPSVSINHVENIPCNPDAVAQNAPRSNPRLPEPTPTPPPTPPRQAAGAGGGGGGRQKPLAP